MEKIKRATQQQTHVQRGAAPPRLAVYSKYRFVFPTAGAGRGTRGVGASVLAHRARASSLPQQPRGAEAPEEGLEQGGGGEGFNVGDAEVGLHKLHAFGL